MYGLYSYQFNIIDLLFNTDLFHNCICLIWVRIMFDLYTTTFMFVLEGKQNLTAHNVVLLP